MPWGSKVDDVSINSDFSIAKNLLGDIASHLLHQAHHVGVVAVGLVTFKEGELRIMLNRDALVAEGTSYLVHLIKSPHYQPFEVQFQCDAEVKVVVKRLIMCCEGSCRSPSCLGLKHRRFYLYKPTAIQEIPYRGDNFAA